MPWSSPPQRASSTKARTQVLRLVSKHLYLLSQLTGPGFSFLSLPLIPLERDELPVRNVSVRRPCLSIEMDKAQTHEA